MATKPMIGINADYRAQRNDSPAFSFISAGYYDSVLKAGGVPVLIPPLEDEEALNRILDLLDAVILVGGADLDPRRDGFMLHPTVRPMDERRENSDRILVDLIAERRIPVLGIGTGMQLINVSQGGTLFLHIPEDQPDALPHYDLMDPTHRHGLLVEPDTMMERVYGEGDIRINSMHHMAVDDIAPGFKATGRCPDGIVEAIESVREDWLAIGCQFHPESTTATAIDIRIFHEFIRAVVGSYDDIAVDAEALAV